MKRFLALSAAILIFVMSGCGAVIRDEAERVSATVVRVVDGDTIRVSVQGKEETIRLLLVDTPESVKPNHPVEPFGLECSEFAKKTLSGKTVELEIGDPERDKYERLLAYVWIDGIMFNEMLLQEGLARVAYVYPPNDKYEDRFRDIENVAKRAGNGIWSIDGYVQEDGFHEEAVMMADDKESSLDSLDERTVFSSCKEAREAGAAPIRRGEPGYSETMDGDRDGIACE